MATHDDPGWTVDEGPSPRAVLMPRARFEREPNTNVEVLRPFLSPKPVRVSGGAATVEITITPEADWARHSALEACAGAAFEALGAATAALQRVLGNVALEKRLNSLSVDFYEDFGKALNQASIAGLRHFLLAHQAVAPPAAMSADSQGRIEATWDAAQGQSASLKFLDDEKFHYALVVETPTGRKRPWGTAGRFEVFVARPEARAILGQGPASPVPPT